MNGAMSLSATVSRELGAALGEDGLSVEPDDLAEYGRDWTRVHEPAPSAIAFPRSTAQVSEVIRICHAHGVAVVPSGGRTGLSAGAVACRGELVLALDRLDTIADFNPVERTVRCGAGVVTAQLQAFASEQGLFYPVDFASAGSSQIGGNISTNAGGVAVLRADLGPAYLGHHRLRLVLAQNFFTAVIAKHAEKNRRDSGNDRPSFGLEQEGRLGTRKPNRGANRA